MDGKLMKKIDYRKVLKLILNDDWRSLPTYFTEDEISTNQIATSSGDYEWAGDYETDARYTYPNMSNLIKIVIKKVLKCQHKKTVAINEEGHAGVYCVDCGEKLEDAC